MAVSIDLSGDLAGIGQVISGGSSAGIGKALAAGDINGDGVPDVVVGAPGYSDGGIVGAAFVIFGGSAAFDGEIDVTSLGSAGISILGGNSGDSAGVAVAAGDFDNDGVDDLAIAASGYDGPGTNRGAVYVIPGNASLSTSIDLGALGSLGSRVIGDADQRFLGIRDIAAVGGFDNDGTDDLLIGTFSATLGDTNSGVAYLIDGDGLGTDITVPTFSGSTFYHATQGAQFGGSVAGGGDVDNDGIPDILVAAPGGGVGQQGAVYLLFGDTVPVTSPFNVANGINLATRGIAILGETGGDMIGDVAMVGDANGDGIDDFVIGARYDDDGASNAGAAYLIFGAADIGSGVSLASLGSKGVKITGANADDAVGQRVTGAGDVNGDGVNDILIAAPGDDDNGSNAGAVYLLFGSADFGTSLDLGSLSDDKGVKILGAAAGDQLGANALTAAGDINSDGLDDVVVGGSSANAAYVLFGFTGTTPGAGLAQTGDAGDDTFFTGAGPDTLSGNGGDDLLAAGSGNDSIDGGDGNDTAYGQSGDDTIMGGAGDDVLRGNLGDDSIEGGDGDDEIKGQFGADIILTGLGLNTAFGGALGDEIDGDADSDTLNGNSGDDTIYGFNGNDLLRGQGGPDELIGGLDNDSLFGMQGQDTLYGGAGDDFIFGGQANDTLYGGDGSDIFAFNVGHGSDVIADFSVTFDRIAIAGGAIEDDQFKIVDTDDGAVITFEALPSTVILLSGISKSDLSFENIIGPTEADFAAA